MHQFCFFSASNIYLNSDTVFLGPWQSFYISSNFFTPCYNLSTVYLHRFLLQFHRCPAFFKPINHTKKFSEVLIWFLPQIIFWSLIFWSIAWCIHSLLGTNFFKALYFFPIYLTLDLEWSIQNLYMSTKGVWVSTSSTLVHWIASQILSPICSWNIVWCTWWITFFRRETVYENMRIFKLNIKHMVRGMPLKYNLVLYLLCKKTQKNKTVDLWKQEHNTSNLDEEHFDIGIQLWSQETHWDTAQLPHPSSQS